MAFPIRDSLRYPLWIRRIVPAPDGGLVVLDQRAARLFWFDSLGRPVRTLGGQGDGPGEFRDPKDLAFLDDTTLAVVENAQMKVTLVTKDGRYLSSFSTPRFGARRIAALDDSTIALAGLYDIGGRNELVAIYTRTGQLVKSAVRAPPLLDRLEPKIDEAFLATGQDHSLVLGSVVVPDIWVIRSDGVAHVSLGDLGSSWVQLQPLETDARSVQELRNWTNRVSRIVGEGFLDDSTFALGWHYGEVGGGADVIATINLSAKVGALYTDAPGYLVTARDDRLALLTSTGSDSNVVEWYTCR